MNIVAVTQARFSSSRLPGKVLLKLGKGTVLDLHLKRIKKSKKINGHVVATTHEIEADQITNIAHAHRFSSYRGDTYDVLDRFYKSCREFNPDHVVRLTSDCPLVDPYFIDDLIKQYLEADVDYASNCLFPTLPDGMDAEIFSFHSLERAWREASKKSDREHVTPYIRNSGKYNLKSIEYPFNWHEFRMTLDTIEDYDVLTHLVKSCGEDASLETYVNYLMSHPETSNLNSKYSRNEGYLK